ncbi:hypothetical protein AXX17_AT1G40440 [Arabidopsis thaliana]|uniref:Uncharacterized protein n=1 Tax=Arabidopsis thaliana TaxID=3702 RepID=A0A178WLP0_ARATH|nr:hypothetical protein AXX17_AT1G40440 [Arabidopsis thaliana]
MASHHAIEVTKTVLEVADVAWTAVETYHHHHHHQDENHESTNPISDPRDRELEALRQENRRLRTLLESNLKLFETLAESAAFSHDCPSDLYARLVTMVTSRDFLARLENIRQALSNGTQNQFPFKEPTDDVKTVEVLIEMDHQEPSWWVLVTDDMVPSNVEEQSAIDNEHYIVVNEDHVIDAVAHFLAKCIMSNPKAKVSLVSFEYSILDFHYFKSHIHFGYCF